MSDCRVDEYAACLERRGDEFAALRPVLLDTELTEAFNDLCALMFFKGALLNDPKALLREQGENGRSSLRVEFRSVADVTSMNSALRDLVADASEALPIFEARRQCGCLPCLLALIFGFRSIGWRGKREWAAGG